MRIDFIIGCLQGGGAERVLSILANEFNKKGADVALITFNEGDAYKVADTVKRIKLHGGTIKNHTIRSIQNLYSYYNSTSRRPDCIISLLTRTNLISILVGRYYNIPVIACEHNNHLKKGPFTDQFAKRFLYRFANQVTVLTNYDVNYYQQLGAKVTVMPNPSTFTKAQSYSVKKEKAILAVGNLDRFHHKGFDNLLQVYKKVSPNFPDWKLKIVGEGKKGYDFLQNIVAKEGMEQVVEFTGFRKDIDRLMQESEIFVLSSRYEGLPMVLLEALSQGMSCIAFDCCTGPSEMIVNGENGVLVEDQNLKAMEESLMNLMSNRELRQEMALKAINSIDKFSTRNIIQKWSKLLHKVGLEEQLA